MKKVSRILLPPPAPNAANTAVCGFVFDSVQELLWAGNEYVSKSGKFYSPIHQSYFKHFRDG